MLKQRELSETYSGGVGSFLLFCMIVCFLRECRRNKKNYTLGEYLLNYLEFYGIDNWTDRRIIMKKNQIVYRPADNVHFSLMSPQDETHDIGSSAFKIKDVFALYRNRYRLLTNYNFKGGESIVKYLVNPSNAIFTFLK
jgi:non-canonical poly(A) RNA polymerase PAPD5/7